jgi:hypothetical protein
MAMMHGGSRAAASEEDGGELGELGELGNLGKDAGGHDAAKWRSIMPFSTMRGGAGIKADLASELPNKPVGGIVLAAR